MMEDPVLKKDEGYIQNYYARIDSMQLKGFRRATEHIIVDYACAYHLLR